MGMELTKIDVDRRIRDIAEVLRIFLQLHGREVNSEVIYALDTFYELALRRQFGEEIADKRQKQLIDFIKKLFDPERNDVAQLDYIKQHYQQILSTKPSRTDDSIFGFHPFSTCYPQVNALILLPKNWRIFFNVLAQNLSRFWMHRYAFDGSEELLIRQWLNNFPAMLDNTWLKMYRDLEYFKERFDQSYNESNKVKVLCLKLGYCLDPLIDPIRIHGAQLEWAKNRTLHHLNIFRYEVKSNERILTSFLKLDFGSHYDFSVFGIFVFKNQKTESMDSIKNEVEKIWEKTYLNLPLYEQNSRFFDGKEYSTQEIQRNKYRELVYKPYCERIIHNVRSGVIAKDSEKYNLFIRTTLNYVINSSALFELWIAGKECKRYFCCENEGLIYKPQTIKQNTKTPKKPRKRSEPIVEKFEFGLWKYFKYIKLRTMEKKSIKNIEFIYGNLVDRYPQIDPQVWQYLMELEAFVYLLAKWKQLPINPDNTSARSKKDDRGTDLQKLYMIFFQKIDASKLFLERLFSHYGFVFSPSVLITSIALCKIQDELNYQEFSKPSGAQLIRLCADIRQLLDQPLSNFANDLRHYLGQNPNNEFKTHVLPSLNQYIETLYQSGKKAKTLSALIKSNQEQASRAKSQYETYWTQKKAFAGENIFISCEVKCAHFASNFKAIDHIFKTTIDKLNKDTSIQLLAYLGCWDILGHAAQINSANITFLFSVCKRDIAMKMDFIQHFMQKLEFVCKKYNDTQTESDDQVSITQTEDRFSTLVIRKLKAGLMQGEEKATIDAWFHYVSQKPSYLKILLDGEIKRAIKGSSNYKGRVKAKNLS
ncbi:hypothetical protein [Acinetobacter haemolyticus]|uniref:Uncharacterized protein n=1 Tax=Acinetobacter haemolyticus TaxID=29430 RepID=A0AAJ2YPT9_ACIHA|nr:hypothetical protein [Acinetobacter haemolyticus]MCU4379487.1 hypothetical protein [Acinetobacter haemolyticus]NAR28395.1 hypothetical protein [Acinetobacter haemolyticus]NAR63097.1 hypothetical protein [Acinetobacter haemolyticus]NAR72186.1 hypothetical protein [Acinetobacter haemolyticus]NAR77351.1 hypothetical protein [Acinetobacter haemolyticus]